MKQILTAILLGLALSAFAATPTITDVTAKQRFPWNGKVDITFTVSETISVAGHVVSLDITATDRASGTTYTADASALSGDTGTAAGAHHVIWDLNAQGLEIKSDDVVFKVAYEMTPLTCLVTLNRQGGHSGTYSVTATYGSALRKITVPTRTGYTFGGYYTAVNGGGTQYYTASGASARTWDKTADTTLYAKWTPTAYCVIDLSAGPSASSYPVTYLAEPPSGGFNVSDYNTTRIVLKGIEAGSFIMGENQNDEAHRVTLTKPFYIGLFEVTKKQYQLVMGGDAPNPSANMLPVETISYVTIRGSSNGLKWPASNAVDDNSFLGKLRARTGLDFDLPTEAQWEYACRAGTTTTYSYGDRANGDYMWYG